MAVNALGLPVQLQASPLQLQDLLGGMQPGDVVKGRILEVLPDGKAVLNLKGQNVVAQLPAGQALQKGDILSLQVTQLSEASAGKAASLVLRLLPSPSATAATALAPLPGQNLPPQALIDQSIAAARVPNNTVSQQVARTLLQLGVPLTPQALANAVNAVESLLANGAAAPSQPATASLPAPIQAAVQQAVAQLQVSIQLNPNSQTALTLRQAVRALQTLTSEAPPAAPPAPASVNGSPAPIAPAPSAPAPFGNGLPIAPAVGNGQPLPAQPAAPAGPAAASAPAPSPAAQATALLQAVAQLIQDPSPADLQAVQTQVTDIRTSQSAPAPAEPQAATVPVPTTVVQAAALPQTPAPNSQTSPGIVPASIPSSPVSNASLPAIEPAVGLVQRETLVQVLAPLTATSTPPSPAVLQAQIGALTAQLQEPASPPAQRLVAAVQAQFPEASPAWILDQAVQTLQSAQSAVAALPQQAQPLSRPQLLQALQDLGLAAPKVDLNSLPIETVAEAVAWLQARDLPPQRPLVEAVAVFLQQDHNALPAAQRALDAAASLPPEVLDSNPPLKAAVQAVQTALSQAELDPATPGLATRLQAWASDQGLNLEARLAAPGSDAAQAAGLNGPQNDKPALRPALQQLEQQLKAELKDPGQRQPEVSATLQSALRETQTANHSLNAIPLQAQPAPAFDTVRMPLPVAFAADLGGQLSITWRQGRDRVLNEKDPVSVAVALNTGELGTVKVLLQVWKDAATARVIAQDPATAAFLSDGADELRDGFAERTPFKLQSLDFAAEKPRERGAGPELPEAAPGGFNLSA